MIRCGMLTVVLLFLFGLIWGGTFLWNRLTTDGDEQTFAGARVIEQPETFPKGKPRMPDMEEKIRVPVPEMYLKRI